MKEDQVVDDALCPEVKPSIVVRCNTCDKGCNPDGSCSVCTWNPICDQASNLDDPSMQDLLCQLECCKCRKFQEVST